jgi:hypothetical protein
MIAPPADEEMGTRGFAAGRFERNTKKKADCLRDNKD